MNRKWSEKTKLEKTATVFSAIALCVWLIFQIVERNNLMKNAEFVNLGAILVICICEAISFWRVKRSLSYVAIAGAVLLSAVTVLQIMLLA